MLTVYKASAGSGKTFRLVAEYLKLILENEKAYRHILAVTFTNKATAEMKERVISQLKLLADGASTRYLDIILQETQLSEKIIRQRAHNALENILFDYNRFFISTIDKFTQRIIKAFNREIGITPNYQLEFENQIIINEAVDRLIERVDTHSELRDWLENFVEDRIDDNKNFDIERDLLKLGKELFKEELQSKLPDLNAFFENKKTSREYLGNLSKIVAMFETVLKKQALDMMHVIAQNGFGVGNFAYGKNGVAGFIEKTARGIVPEQIGIRTLEALSSEEKWVTKNNKQRNEILPLVSSKLLPMLQNMVSFYESKNCEYYTAKAIKKDWFSMAVLMDLNLEIMALNREKGILPMAGSNYLLKSIIDGNEMPFVYEKTGVWFHHFMLDEFQDTSEMQWDNFRPLISNSLGQGHANLVVGDVKQSIYRWRNSSWNILAHKIFEELRSFNISALSLNSNFRSDENVVTFNNHFLTAFTESTTASNEFGTFDSEYKTVSHSVYADIEQKNEQQNGQGYVKISLLASDEKVSFKKYSIELLAQQIESLLNNGFASRDIAILVRKKTDGEAIMRYFLDNEGKTRKHDFRILSGESLFLKSSPAVNFVVNLLNYLANPNSNLTKAVLLQLYNDIEKKRQNAENIELKPDFQTKFEVLFAEKIATLQTHFLTSSIDEMIIRICDKFEFLSIPPEIPFVQSLIDKAAELGKNMPLNSSDFLEWWNEKGQTESVPINEDVDAVRLLTIHKSKGLEFKAVLIPFFDWKLAEHKDTFLWCVPNKAPFDKVPLTPVSMSKNLTKTIFADYYYNEMFNSVIDNLNLVYVAFTRACSILMVNAPAQNAKNSIGFTLIESLSELAKQPAFADAWNEEKQTFEYGEIPVIAQAASAQQEYFEKWQFNDFTSKLRLRTKSNDFVLHSEEKKTGKNLGKIIHEILAQIETVDQVDHTLEKALLKLAILPDEMEIVKNQIYNIIRQPIAADWFSGKYKILNEQEILTPDIIYRPDRIMIDGEKAIVVDFKTGKRNDSAYKKQVEQYKHILQKTGFNHVDGFIWYLQTNEIVTIAT